MSRYYRIHTATESLETVLDARRPDGWVAGDESLESQPLGVSACESLQDLSWYCGEYSMAIRDDDRLVELVGTLSPERDRDDHAVRVLATGYRVIATGAELLEAIEWVDDNEWRVDTSSGSIDWADADEDGDLTDTVRGLVEGILLG